MQFSPSGKKQLAVSTPLVDENDEWEGQSIMAGAMIGLRENAGNKLKDLAGEIGARVASDNHQAAAELLLGGGTNK